MKTIRIKYFLFSVSLLIILVTIVLQASAMETNASDIVILDPKEGSNVSAGNLTVMVEVKNFNLTTWQNVSQGRHILSVQLVNNDHTPLSPPVVKAVNVTATSAKQNAVMDLVARGIAFDKKVIAVLAGANVTVNFDNQDTGIPHNFAVYDSAMAKKTIFRGDIIRGPMKIIYRFDAPQQPGIYFFRCDPHPLIMNGQFVVQ